MVRKTNIIFALEGMLYDIEMWHNIGHSPESQMAMFQIRVKRLLADLRMEERHNAKPYKKLIDYEEGERRATEDS